MTPRLPVLPFLSAYLLPVLHVAALGQRGPWLWLLPAYVFVLVPLLDRALGAWRAEVPGSAPRRRAHDALLELWTPVQLAVLGWTLHVVARAPLAPAEWVPFALSTGLVTGGVGITVAHELMHRPGRLHRALAEVLMTSVLYAHFCVEHVHGHHRRVGTREDPATARRGEAVYAFLARSVLGGLASAWRLEGRRAERLGLRGLADRRLRYALTHVAVVAGVLWLGGPLVLGAFLAQAAVAVVLLELINYVEHYGLVRERGASGRPGRVEPRHSWNSNHGVSSAHLFLLTRHSHHHAEARRPYDGLRALPDAPMLPAGYPTMMLASLVPPLWFRLMDGRVAAASA